MVIPFFVLDRPASLEILKCFFAEHLDYKFGILTHAFVSRNFKNLFKNFPYYTKFKYCDNEVPEILNKKIENQIIKMVDSGIFQGKRNITYEDLFQIYDFMNANYGIIIDFLKDKEKTLISAENALRIYEKRRYKFKLVGVAQGKTIEEYLECYDKLQKLGYEYIAIGGLLKQNGNSNYRRLFCEKTLICLLDNLKREFNPNWIFTLGIYHPSRHKLLERYGVWGADYKGWIFEYEEDYSFANQYIKNLNISQEDKNILFSLFEQYRKFYKQKKRDRIKLIKREIESILRKYDMSLQFLRFKRVRENLKLKIVKEHMENK